MPNRKGRPWRRIRAFVLNRDSFACQLRYPGICTTRATEVDHIVMFINRKDLELDPTNLRAVCVPCHTHRTGLQASGNDRPPHIEPSRSW